MTFDQFVAQCEQSGIGFSLYADYEKVTPENRYELRVFNGPARSIYRGATPDAAADAALGAIYDARQARIIHEIDPETGITSQRVVTLPDGRNLTDG